MCSESWISRKLALQKGAESRQLAQISNPAHLRPEKCQCTRKSERRGAGTIFSGDYCLKQNSFPTEPQPKIWKCQNRYPASIKPPRLAGCSHPKRSDILHALLQAPRLQASAAAGTSADPAWKNSWLVEYSYFYLLFCILTLHCKCWLCFTLGITNPNKVLWNHWAISVSSSWPEEC